MQTKKKEKHIRTEQHQNSYTHLPQDHENIQQEEHIKEQFLTANTAKTISTTATTTIITE